MALIRNIRLFIDQEIDDSSKVKLLNRHVNYLKNVMRCNDGDIVRIFNGKNGEWHSKVEDIQGKAYLNPYKKILTQNSYKEKDVWLIYSLIKNSRAKYLIEKATELGVSKIIAVISLRSNIKKINLDKNKLTAIEAAEQSGRLTIPEFEFYESYSALFSKWPRERSIIWGNTNAKNFEENKFSGVGGLLIGPEGGFDPEEVKLFNKLPNSHSISLGNLVMRCETAAMAMLTIWSYENNAF